MSEKIDRLVGYIERWSTAHPRRNVTMLSRLSGVAYPTLRRILMKESMPTIENAMAILNTVATLDETIAWFSDNASIQDFCSRFNRHRTSPSDSDVVQRLMKRESFWIVALALSVGATHAKVEKLLGSFGVAEFQTLIEEGLLHEESHGIFRTSSQALTEYIDSHRVGDEVIRHIAEVPTSQGDLKRFLTFNVTLETFNHMKRHMAECYAQLVSMARSNPGHMMMAASLTMLRIYDEESASQRTIV